MIEESAVRSETTPAVTGGFRLSPQQRRTWRLDRHRSHPPGTGAWRVLRAFDVEGDLDAVALRRALAAAAQRHEILRTALRRLPGLATPVQAVEPARAVALDERDLAALAPEERAAAAEALLDEARREPLDPEAPPLRVRLARLAPGRALLVLSAPATHLDRAGLEALVRELSDGSTGAAAAAGDADDDEPMQYADLAEWQNGLLEAEEAASEAERWRRQGVAEAPRLRLPFERPAAPAAPFEPASVAFDLAPELAAAGEALARRAGASLADLVLAAWRVLLGRLTGCGDLVLGVALEGREYEGLDALPGPLAKVVPLTLGADGAWTPERLLRQAAEALAEERAAQEYWSWQAVLPDADGGDGAPPCFPLGFELRRELPELRLGAARLRPREERSVVDPFTLHLVCRETAGGTLRLELAYDPRRVDAADARRTLGQLAALAGALATERPATVAAAGALSAEERAELAADAAASASCVDGGARPVHERFLAAARRHPERPALACGERTLSYGELAAWVRAEAAALRRAGVGPEQRVALCFERSPELVAALLAVLAAGGAYVPLDPALPRRRLLDLLAASGARRVLAAPELAPWFAEASAEVLSLGDPTAAAEAAEELPAVAPESLAYLLFTSGSTGTPKAVAVEHRQLAAYVRAVGERIPWPPGGRFATVSTFAADLGLTMVFPALCGGDGDAAGGCLDVVPAERVSDPEAFAAYAAEHGIDCLKIVPSHLEALLTAADPARVLPRRVLVLGGEALGAELAERVRALAPELAAFNHYGPTETTVGVVAGVVPETGAAASAAAGAQSVPLGRPLAHARVHLLDAALQPVPTWGPGELYVGGAGVARGYLGQPGRTAERFVPDPFGSGGRLYRTGDLARRLPGGAFEFLGRADGQVKIRGFRVETGEVEALLAEHPGVRRAVVAPRSEDGGEPRLVAWVVAAGAEPPAAGELRAFLAERLPEAMLPAAFVPLAALPLTANGKVDRAALPAPDGVRPELAATYVAPASDLERAVAAIWQDVLRLEKVGLDDNFFDLGGHSLLLVQVSARLREDLGREVSMVELFRHTTVAALVAHLEAAPDAAAAAREAAARAEAAGERGEGRRDSLARQRELRRQRRGAAAS